MCAAGVRGHAGVHPGDRAHLPRLDIQRLAELGRVAYDVRGAIGISPHAWGQAWITLGGDGAITALAAICARHATGDVKSPGGLLRKMVDLHGKGTLRLDATLFGLADKLKKAAVKPAAGPARSGGSQR